ncbi:MAG: CoA ester lyase [Synergistaceae bacterium]|jgi:citrate lyase subunit beta/citryl-CoA lyase|nr:CoA ester lyase [Synergistaceae bacterium]
MINNSKNKKNNRPCRSMLYIPGDSPGMIQNAPVFGADSILLDLEDAIAASEKDAARKMVRSFLRSFDFGDLIVTVRINGADTEYFKKDLMDIVPCRPDAVRLPKCSSPEDVISADSLISEIELESGIPVGCVQLHAMLETALGIENAYQIAIASPRVSALTLGGQDLTADMGVQKTRDGWELFYARSRVVLAARAAKISAFDTVWADINDPDGLFKESKQIVELGFTGKAAIHPSQIEVIHRAYRPDPKELAKSQRIVEAAKEAAREGKGVISVGGRMVDAPVAARAENLVAVASLYDYEEESPV